MKGLLSLYQFPPETYRLLVYQEIECTSCGSNGEAFLDMGFVHEDKVLNDKCPSCSEYKLIITTFRENNG